MYKVETKEKFKSIHSFSQNFPNLVILTGVNGSGKTHFLEALSNQSTEITENENNLTQRRLIRTRDLIPSIYQSTNLGRNSVNSLWNIYSSAIGNSMLIYSPSELSFDEKIGKRNLRKIKIIAEYAGKDIQDLEFSDFEEHIPVDDIGSIDDILAQPIWDLFDHYNDKYLLNDHRRYLKEWRKEKNVSYLSEEDFLEKYGDPVAKFNDLIKSLNLDLEFVADKETINGKLPAPKLVNTSTKTPIHFEDISSGEKTIMSLVFALYSIEHDCQIPQVLLLDEPDATLHPSMVKQFLEFIEDILIKKEGVKVVITTHSPTTVALSPEDSIFVMTKKDRKAEKKSKDEVLRILTEGIPTLSINYENRRQVIVESEEDVAFYSKMYAKLSKELNPEISLTFISSGDTRTDANGNKIANCEQVKSAVRIFRNAGNKLIFGIIDWDTSNSESEGIKVLGKNSRYAIENYIFDPILIGAFLLDEGAISKNDLKLNDNESYSDFKNFSSEKLQKISDFVISKTAENLSPLEDDNLKVKYKNGIEIEMPKWYLQHQGHKLEEFLEDSLKKNFGQLKKFHRPSAIRKQIVDKFIENMPDFVSQDILDIFLSIQNA